MAPQRLLFPFHRGMIICGYKTAQYLRSWGYPHYGLDISTYQGVRQADHIIRASGNGTVVAVGKDSSLGMGVAIRYDNCLSHEGTSAPLIARYLHMSKVSVKYGQKVKAGDEIAEEGKEGTTDYHLHFELDTDVNYPTYTPQVSAGHIFWKKGTDTTVNPSHWLWQSTNAITEPYSFSNRAWINEGIDTDLPFVPIVPAQDEVAETIIALNFKIDELTKQLEEERSIRMQCQELLNKLQALINQ